MSLTLYDHAATMMTSTAAAAPPMVSTPLRLADPVSVMPGNRPSKSGQRAQCTHPRCDRSIKADAACAGYTLVFTMQMKVSDSNSWPSVSGLRHPVQFMHIMHVRPRLKRCAQCYLPCNSLAHIRQLTPRTDALQKHGVRATAASPVIVRVVVTDKLTTASQPHGHCRGAEPVMQPPLRSTC